MLFAVYVICGFFYIRFFRNRSPIYQDQALIALQVNVGLHGLFIARQWMQMGPLSMGAIFGFIAFALLFLVILSSHRKDPPLLLLPYWPLAIIMLLVSYVVPSIGVLRPETQEFSQVIFAHIALALS